MDMEDGEYEYDTSAREMNGDVLLRQARASPGRMTFGNDGTAGFRGPTPANRIRMRRVRDDGVTEALYMSAHGLLIWVGPREDDQDVEQDNDPYGNGRFGAVPALEAEILRLPMATPCEVRETDCAVCLDSFEEGEVLRKMTCPSSHAFHQGCIIDWLRVSRLCPLCRFALPADREQDDQEEQEDTERNETPCE